jgi:hypothetical protein
MRRDHLHIGAGAQNNTSRLPYILFATEIKLASTNTWPSSCRHASYMCLTKVSPLPKYMIMLSTSLKIAVTPCECLGGKFLADFT